MSRDVLIDHHVYVGRLPNGDAIEHACDGTDCRLPEQIEQMEREREGRERVSLGRD